MGPTKEGRATAIAAMCLKSRVALYAASPLYTIEKVKLKNKLWETAAQYAMEAIQLSGTSLPAMKADFFEKPDHAEILWRNYQEDINTPEQNNFIPQLYGWGRTNPSQQLVDAFPMKTVTLLPMLNIVDISLRILILIVIHVLIWQSCTMVLLSPKQRLKLLKEGWIRKVIKKRLRVRVIICVRR